MRLVADTTTWNGLVGHLLPDDSDCEFAAFLFGRYGEPEQMVTVIEHYFVPANDLVHQERDHLELSADVRPRLIKRAHDLGACLIEAHSHPFPANAMFSTYDIANLRETVPHMLWRLRGQPYIAIVVGPTNFDALVWKIDFEHVGSLSAIATGKTLIKPTNASLSFWR
jgi:hypothetical protein